MNRSCLVQDQLNTSEPTAPYIIGRELNLRKLPGRQGVVGLNPQPFKQLRPMTDVWQVVGSIPTADRAVFWD